ncbi:ABC transporter permease [Marinomonas mediterranea]|uniref:ABC-type transporter, integral membrane subunit n=1 Tax=Marinomonas mediterranea (strain ATCC 700492 / JCM 21426 / NBRC 103028 / MMB-1) TaxID=717774 RepID=F2K4Y3_MARM1|nr:iron ABC transporter permease [Marinomonas mediterranea]ADZ92626.1 ABC-type transporter, integral membrane subunit [Marinomonas mediterranea MMB-1]WCN18662.1 ABC transporter permease subunit [Marinomonas mediterranea MMB-1]
MYSNARGSRLPLAFNLVSIFSLFLIIGLPVISVVLFAIFPSFNELSFARPFSNFIPQFSNPHLLTSTLNTLRLAFSVTLMSIMIAVILAYLRSRMHDHYGRIWDVLFLIPFLIPPYIASMAWIQMFQFNGFFYQWFDLNLSGFLFSFSGVVFVMTLHLFPLIYFAAVNAFKVVGNRYSDVAKIYGAGSVQIAFRILLPLIVPTLLSTGLIVFALTIEEFGTPDILGSRFGFSVLVTSIEEKLTDWPIDLPGASVLSLLLITIAISVYLIQIAISKRYTDSVDNQTMASKPLNHKGFMLVSHGIFFFVAVFTVVVPLFSILTSSMMQTMSRGLHWNNLSLEAYQTLFSLDDGALDAIYTSLTLALMTALITAVIGMLVAFTLIRLKPKGHKILDALSLLPNAMPAMVLSVGLILTWNQKFLPVTPYNTLFILLLAYTCLMLSYPIRMLTAAMKQLPASLDEAAAIYGADLLLIARRILFPLLIPISVAAGCIVFAISTRELVASLILAPAGTETVATYVFNQFDQGSVSSGMAMSFVVIVVSGMLIALGQLLAKRHAR